MIAMRSVALSYRHSSVINYLIIIVITCTDETARRNGAAGPSRRPGRTEQVLPGSVRGNGAVPQRGVGRSQQTARLPEDAPRPEHQLSRERSTGQPFSFLLSFLQYVEGVDLVCLLYIKIYIKIYTALRHRTYNQAVEVSACEGIDRYT